MARTTHPSEIVRTLSTMSDASHIVSVNYHNAILNFAENSILVSRRIGQSRFKKFLKLREQWKKETKFYSNPTDMFSNEAYQNIIYLGELATPWIIRELKKKPDYWFYALRNITGANPVPDEHAGNLVLMTEDWLNWAKNNGIDE